MRSCHQKECKFYGSNLAWQLAHGSWLSLIVSCRGYSYSAWELKKLTTKALLFHYFTTTTQITQTATTTTQFFFNQPAPTMGIYVGFSFSLVTDNNQPTPTMGVYARYSTYYTTAYHYHSTRLFIWLFP